MRGEGGGSGLIRVLGGDGLEGRTLKRVKLFQQHLRHARRRRGRFRYQDRWGILTVRVVRRCMLGEKGRGGGATVRGHAGGRSHGTGHQQRGGVVEEGFEEARHFLQLLTDGGHLAGEDAHLHRGESITYPGFYLSRLYWIDGMVIVYTRHVWRSDQIEKFSNTLLFI